MVTRQSKDARQVLLSLQSSYSGRRIGVTMIDLRDLATVPTQLANAFRACTQLA